MPTQTMRVGSRKPDLRVTLTDKNGVAVDLTNASTVTVQLLNPSTKAVVKSGAAVIEAPATAGIVRYEWAAADLDTAGLYRVVWLVSWSGGLPQTFPLGTEFTLYVW